VFAYPQQDAANAPSISQVADALRNWISNHASDSRIAFIAHSLGGLVVRRFVVASNSDRQRQDMNVSGIAFLASPHDTSFAARVGRSILHRRREQLTELVEQSPTMIDLTKRWSSWVEDNVPQHCRLMSIYGTSDKVVGSAVHAISSSEDAIPILGKNHEDIATPSDENDELVTTLGRFLQQHAFVAHGPFA
jgi:esterase/lipase superfamily enzyme